MFNQTLFYTSNRAMHVLNLFLTPFQLIYTSYKPKPHYVQLIFFYLNMQPIHIIFYFSQLIVHIIPLNYHLFSISNESIQIIIFFGHQVVYIISSIFFPFEQ